MRTTDEEIHMLKTVEYYSAGVNAWLATKFERDKSLLALSTAATGLLLTLISTVGIRSVESLVLYISALFCFVICLITVLIIFSENARYLQDVIVHNGDGDRVLSILDKIAIYFFMLGVILALAIGISTAIQSYSDKAKTMTDDKKASVIKVEVELRKSFNNFTLLSPAGPKTGSTEGIHNLRPEKPATPAAAPAPAKPSNDSK